MASWNHDGTQDPAPPPLMPDPLAGGGKYEAEAVRVRVVEPTAPDIDKVRAAMASVLDEDSELMIGLPPARVVEPPPAAENMGANDPDAGDGGEGVGPAAESTVLPPTPPVGMPAIPAIPAARIPPPRGLPPRPLRRPSFSPGVALVVLLLLVIGVLVIVMLASLIDTISSLFG
jgi:hypothetical protein